MADGWRVETYVLKRGDGTKIRQATRVISPQGKVIHFMEKMPKRSAIKQARRFVD